MATSFRFNVANKMLMALLPLSLLIIVISAFALSTINRLNKINNSIVIANTPLVESADEMIDHLLAEELYGRRYALLKSPEILELFRARSGEFERLIGQIRGLPGEQNIPANRLLQLHREYEELFLNGFNHMEKPSSPAAKERGELIKEKQGEIITLVKTMSNQAVSDRNDKRLLISKIGEDAFLITGALCLVGIILSIGIALLITRNITGHINQLNMATRIISEGKFDQVPEIQNQDELGELSTSFGEMAKSLKALKEIYLDANPLTKLPGSVAAENVINKRLEAGSALAVCLLDIDNFKAYNDKYGYARGNDLIKTTAQIIVSTVAEHGTDDDFIGHIGGDDFLVLTTPDAHEILCRSIISRFDEAIYEFYNREDWERGYFVGVNRKGQEITFSPVTISIAVVTNESRELLNHIQVGEIAAELKSYAKSLPGSVYVVDRRRG